MILPIVAYGAKVLRNPGKNIQADYPGLTKLVEDMWETMYESSGVGLAAPQINKPIRLFSPNILIKPARQYNFSSVGATCL